MSGFIRQGQVFLCFLERRATTPEKVQTHLERGPVANLGDIKTEKALELVEINASARQQRLAKAIAKRLAGREFDEGVKFKWIGDEFVQIARDI